MKLTPTEKKLFKEAIIKEYKLKHQAVQKKLAPLNTFLKGLKKIMPFNITVGIIACVALIYLKGWETLVYLLLSGVIWITLISTFVSALIKSK